jgi:hypothetical protein
MSFEGIGHDALDLGKLVEPVNEGDALVTVVETTVELVADGAREAGDFAGAGHGL